MQKNNSCSDKIICGNDFSPVKIPFAYENQNHLYYRVDTSFQHTQKNLSKDALKVVVDWKVYRNECYAVRDGEYDFSYDSYPTNREKTDIHNNMFHVYKYKDVLDKMKRRKDVDAYK